MNNEVIHYGEVVGFRCFECGEVRQSMWGNICNSCRSRKDESAKLRAEIAKLTETIRQNERRKEL